MTKDEARRRVVAYWMKKAETALLSAQSEYEEERYDFAANRVYYACFYSASAVLLQLGQKFVKHTGVRAAVHRDLVKAGKLDPRWGKVYDRIFESRLIASREKLRERNATVAHYTFFPLMQIVVGQPASDGESREWRASRIRR